MNKYLYSLFVALFATLLVGCSSHSNSNKEETTAETESSASESMQYYLEHQKWHYYEAEDEMTENKKYTADVYSETNHNINGYPICLYLNMSYYPNNPSNAQLVIGFVAHDIENNQAGPHLAQTGIVMVKFDDGKAQTINAQANNSSICLVSDQQWFVEQVKTSQKLIVRVKTEDGDFYDFTYNLAGFSWIM